MWKVYPAIHAYFSNNSRDGMKKTENIHSIEDLAPVTDILKELSLLSLALQSHSVTIVTADHLLIRYMYKCSSCNEGLYIKGNKTLFSIHLFSQKLVEPFH
jgi:hypothetical protein